MSRSVSIIGLGLIGGSLGMSLRRRGWDVSFVDPNVSESDARSREAATRKLEAIPGDVDLVVLATPVDVALRELRGVGVPPTSPWPSRPPSSDAQQPRGETPHGMSAGRRPTKITSTCSVMLPLVRAARDIDLIAGHPLAGSEKRGLLAARADLFEGKRWFVSRNDPVVDEMIAATDATAHVVDPEEHDRAIAFTSHLPQLMSTALAALLAEKGSSLEPFFGSGLATVLRLAGSDQSVWESVFSTNRENISAAGEELFVKMREIGGSDFQKAQELWKKLSGA